MLSVCYSYVFIPLLIIIKFKEIHSYSISVYTAKLLKLCKYSIVSEELLEEIKALLRFKVRISEHLLDSWTLDDIYTLLLV